MNFPSICSITGWTFARNWTPAPIARNRCCAWTSSRNRGRPARWGFRRWWTASSSKHPARGLPSGVAQVVSAQWEPHFHPHSYGFRPQRSAHQAVREVQANIRAGYGWVVDMDLQAFFDRVNQDRLMARLKSRCPDADLLRLINRFLKAGVSVEGQIVPTHLGVP